MGKITRKRSTPPKCKSCGSPLETAATTQNPSATIMPLQYARCPSCLVLFIIGGDLLPSPDLSDDEGAFNAAVNANPEIKQWATNTLEASHIRSVNAGHCVAQVPQREAWRCLTIACCGVTASRRCVGRRSSLQPAPAAIYKPFVQAGRTTTSRRHRQLQYFHLQEDTSEVEQRLVHGHFTRR